MNFNKGGGPQGELPWKCVHGVHWHSRYFWPVFVIRPVGVLIDAGKADPHVGLEAARLKISAVEVGLFILFAGRPTETSVTQAMKDRTFAWPRKKKKMMINFCSSVT